jgi:hypothetical protein
MEESCLLDLNELSRGDSVFCLLNGYGYVEHIDLSAGYEITVKFHLEDETFMTESYTKDFKMRHSHLNMSLYKYSPFTKAVEEVKNANRRAKHFEEKFLYYELENMTLNDRVSALSDMKQQEENNEFK